MTLIKLCRPSMETDANSLVDRIRQLEEKIENGIPAVVSTGMGAESAGGSTADSQPVVKAELPKAIPEDVKQTVGKWSAIVGEASMPMKAYLKSAYPSLAGDGSLLVVVEDGLPSDYFREAQHREELERIVCNFIGKEMKVTVQSAEQGRNPEELFPDLTKVVSQVIHMEVEELEEEPEELI